MTPIVSVIVTSYNYGRYIGKALASVRRQTLRDFEAIVIDDGSTDQSLRIIQRSLGDSRFRLIRQSHAGQPQTKNRGLAEARAPYVAFLDADDIRARTKLEKQVARFEPNPNLGVVCTQRVLIDENDAPQRRVQAPIPHGHVVDSMFRQNFVCFSSAMVRAGVAEHVGGFDTSIPVAIDYDFWLRVARHYAFGVIEQPLVAYRVGHANLSQRQLDRLHVARLIMQRFVANYDAGTTLSESSRMLAEAETLTHLGVIARGYSRRASATWFLRAMKGTPFHGPAWKGLISSGIPGAARRFARRLLGRSGDWELRSHSKFNRPESVL